MNDFLKSHMKEDYEIILSNDGSTDRSLRIAQALEKSLPRLRIVSYPHNQGRGYAVKFAARICNGNIIIFADLDFPQTTRLEKILEMLAQLEENQIVIGSRFLSESKTKRILLRDVVGRAYRFFVRVFFPELKIKDPDVGFKGFHQSSFAKINQVSKMNRWPWDLEVMVIAQKNNLKIAEIPIDWNEMHEKGASSVKLFQACWEEFFGMLQIKRNLKKGFYSF